MPAVGALKAVLAFPSTYSVWITSLGYQVVWASLASRSDVDVRRLFTDQGDPPHAAQRGRGAGLDLFGLSLSWELDGPVLLYLLEQLGIPLWSQQRGRARSDRVRRRPGAHRQPRTTGTVFRRGAAR